jgi:hypothetical protein
MVYKNKFHINTTEPSPWKPDGKSSSRYIPRLLWNKNIRTCSQEPAIENYAEQ